MTGERQCALGIGGILVPRKLGTIGQTMSTDLEQAEFANEAFYLAFESADFDAMAHLWSEVREVQCLHPGWPALIGREKVLESWQAILSNPRQGPVSFFEAHATQLGDGVFAVTCYERAGDGVMVALNVFAREDDRLRMVAHQAGWCSNPPE